MGNCWSPTLKACAHERGLVGNPPRCSPDLQRCGDRYLILAWGFHGGTNRVRIWRVNTDGSNPKQLIPGTFDRNPVCSPDGKKGPHWSMRAPLEGGEPEPVPSADFASSYGLGAGDCASPDGRLLAINVELTNPADPQAVLSKLEVVNLD
jgi:hypothetical protein